METTMVYVYKYPMNIHMNYYIEKHDMKIILDALQFLHEHMISCSKEELNYPYTIEDVDGLFQSFDNSFAEDN